MSFHPLPVRRPLVALLALLSFALPVRAQDRAADHRRLIEQIDAKQAVYADVARQIWTFAETGFKEDKSSALLAARLEAAGFTVQRGVAGLPTALVASYGSGKPVVAFIGEYDALPGLSQDAVPEKRPVTAGAPGHGCGHNLLGTASMAAAIARQGLAGIDAAAGHRAVLRHARRRRRFGQGLHGQGRPVLGRGRRPRLASG